MTIWGIIIYIVCDGKKSSLHSQQSSFPKMSFEAKESIFSQIRKD